MKYLAEEEGLEELGKRNDPTEEEQETVAQIVTLGMFLENEHEENLKEIIDGMSAYELLDFVNENFQLDPFTGAIYEKK